LLESESVLEINFNEFVAGLLRHTWDSWQYSW